MDLKMQCDIEFVNNPLKEYYTGDTMDAKISFHITEPEKIRAAYAHVTGTAYTHWSEKRESFVDEEKYFGGLHYLIGTDLKSFNELRPGEYSYRLKATLPERLPSSYKSDLGYTEYSIVVIVELPHRLPEVFEGKFKVIRRVNLNENLVMREPAIAEMRANIFPCLLYGHFTIKPLDMVIKTPFSGYAPGQTIDLLLNVTNASLEPVTKFSVELIRQIDFVSRSKYRLRATRSEIVTLVEKFTPGCGAKHSENIHTNILVPDTPPTDTTVTQIIKIHYFIRVTAKMDRFHCDPMMEMPIIIGSHPILGEPYGQIAVQTPKKPTILELSLENLTNGNPILSSELDPRVLAQQIGIKNEDMML